MLIIHDYIVLLCKKTPVKDGYKYEKSDVDVKTLTEEEVFKLVGDVKKISEALEFAIWNKTWKTKPIVETPSTAPIAGAEVKEDSK